jgi:hypothetical protein
MDVIVRVASVSFPADAEEHRIVVVGGLNGDRQDE